MTDSLAKRLGQIAKDAGYVGAAIVSVGFNKDALAARVALEQAAMRLTMVTPSACREIVIAEVARRTDLMGERSALESVYDDIVIGRWQP